MVNQNKVNIEINNIDLDILLKQEERLVNKLYFHCKKCNKKILTNYTLSLSNPILYKLNITVIKQ